MTTTPKTICGIDETGWLRCKNPLRMPKVVRGRWAPRRKFALVVCAYALESPTGFRTEFARRAARVAQARWLAMHPRTSSGVAVAIALSEAFPGELIRTPGAALNPRDRASVEPDYWPLCHFLSVVSGPSLPTRGTVNHAAERCLGAARDEARAEVQRQLDAMRVEFRRARPPAVPRLGWRDLLERLLQPFLSPGPRPPAAERPRPPDFRAAILDLLPEAERATFALHPWQGDQIPPAVATRLGTLAATARAAEVGAKMTDTVREIVGNPFRPVTLRTEWREANFGAALRIAEHAVNSGDYSQVPILADALEDAGCDDAELLAHCRGQEGVPGEPVGGSPAPVEHVAGCWAVDTVLGWN